jgi:hypothetical protein
VTEFSWRRHRLFELESVFALYELVLENPLATVSKVTKKNTKKWQQLPFSWNFLIANVTSRKPYPLTTVELQKAASRILKLTPKKILDVSRFACPGLESPLMFDTNRSQKAYIRKGFSHILARRQISTMTPSISTL